MTRIPMLSSEEMSAEQRALYDAVVSGPRGAVIGPLRAAIHSPELAQLWSKLGEFLRYRTCLPKRLNELAIIVTGRRWTSQIEWWVHARAGEQAGLSAAVIEAIRVGEAPEFADPEEAEIYEFARQVHVNGEVPDDVYEAVKQRWGVRGVVELTAVIGYYTMVSITLNTHHLPLPDGITPPLSKLDAPNVSLTVLPKARIGKPAAD